MPRDIDSQNIAASEADSVIIVILCRLDYASGVVCVNSTNVHIVYNGETYYGLGDLATIGTVKETVDQQSNTVNLQISGVDPTNIAQSLNEAYQGRDAQLLVALLNPDLTVIGTPTIIFRGKMDNQTITLGQTGTITLSVIGRLADLFVPRVSRYNNQDQQSKFPKDKGLEFTAAAVNADITWGK